MDVCFICMEPLATERCVPLKNCSHSMHAYCVAQLFIHKKQGEEVNCPACRTSLFDKPPQHHNNLTSHGVGRTEALQLAMSPAEYVQQLPNAARRRHTQAFLEREQTKLEGLKNKVYAIRARLKDTRRRLKRTRRDAATLCRITRQRILDEHIAKNLVAYQGREQLREEYALLHSSIKQCEDDIARKCGWNSATPHDTLEELLSSNIPDIPLAFEDDLTQELVSDTEEFLA